MQRTPMTWRITLLIPFLLTAACGSSTTTATTSPVGDPNSLYTPTYAALCDALEAATGSDVVAAKRIFFDGAHTSLHDLARDVAEIDRSVSARLLEAKQRLEDDFASLDAAASTHLNQLIVTVDTVLATLGHTPPPPCTTEGTS